MENNKVWKLTKALLLFSTICYSLLFVYEWSFWKGYDIALEHTGWIKIEPPMKVGNIEFMD